MVLHLHLGAHKTATTFLQAQLNDHPDRLAAADVGYVPIAELRSGFTNRFDLAARADRITGPVLRPGLRKRLSGLLRPLADRSLIVLSDENLAGLIIDNGRKGRLYPSIGARARLMTDLISGRDIRLFFAVRPQADYLVSAWLQMASRGRVMPFADFMSRFNPDRPGWIEPVSQLVSAIGADRLTVWTYDWFRQTPSQAVELLAPGVSIPADAEAFSRTVLPSLSAKGLAVMQALEGKLSRPEWQRMAKMMRGFKFDPPDDKIALTDPVALSRWDRRYREDLSAMSALGIRLMASEAELAPAA